MRHGTDRALVLIFVLACGSERSQPGQEHQPCFPNATCDVRLICQSNVCVRPSAYTCLDASRNLLRLAGSGDHERDDETAVSLAAECKEKEYTQREIACAAVARTLGEIKKCKPDPERPVSDEPPPETKPW